MTKIKSRLGADTEKSVALLPIEHGIKSWFRKQEGAQCDGELAISDPKIDAGGKALAGAETRRAVD